MAEKSVFEVLNAIDCSEHIEKKNGLTYLSWAWAWQILKKHYPASVYTIYESADGLNYHTDGRTCWVKTGVTVEGIEHIEYLPVMDFRNASILVDKVTSFDVNKAIQRSLTKAVARHGLGLYIYAGEDLPDAADDDKRPAATPKKAAPAPAPKAEKPASISMDKYWKIVAAAAKGELTKSGVSMREWYIQNVRPDAAALADFDAHVKDIQSMQ
jgi:hypothetical protein